VSAEGTTGALQGIRTRALYDESTIRIYQAYLDAIADSARANGAWVVPPFKMEWVRSIKPLFLWKLWCVPYY